MAAFSTEGYEESYNSVVDAMRAIKANNDEIIDEYEGYIY